MKLRATLTFFLILPITCAGQPTYSVEDIPDSLRENANVVYFKNEGHYEIYDDTKAVFRTHMVAAILNPKGKTHAMETLAYDKLSKINYFKGATYNENGKIMKKLKKSEIIDQSATSEITIFHDNRLQYANLSQNDYPYIVEFETEKEYKVTFFMPNWHVLPDQNTSVLKSKFSISAPSNFLPRVKITNSEKVFERKAMNEKVEMSIEFNHVKATEKEPYGPPIEELSPVIFCSPSNFAYEDYSGDLSTWDSFGKWIAMLNADRSNLGANTINEVKNITSQFESREEKIRAIYQYVQNKTRYVSIQLGIGGYQPFPASTVDDLGYGDCKALSNYTYSLLKAVNIPSNYVLIHAGKDAPKLDPNFSENRFNHAILCVPNEQDTVWLECTSQVNPFGYLGHFTGDRDALLITENGGKVVHTPIYDKNKNIQSTSAIINFDTNGSAVADIKVEYKGLQYENNNLNYYINKGDDELKKWIYKNTQIADFTINSFDFIEKKEKIPSIVEKLTVEIPRLTKPNGKRYFLTPNLLNRNLSIPANIENRKTDILLKFEGIDFDTIVYKIPQHLHTEYIQEPIRIESKFGKYYSSATMKDGNLVYIRKMEFHKGVFPKEDYEEFRNYFKEISKADKTKTVFVDKT